MADPISFSSVNPLANANLGANIGTMGSIAIVIAIVVVILGLIGFLIYISSVKKQYFLKIHLFKLVGNVPTRIAIHVARPVNFGMAGDQLWRVAPNKAIMKAFKIIKWLPVGKIQTGANEFWYYLREDGEWINFSLKDLNQTSREMNVKFVNEDMRLQRLATERLLEQRLMNKNFWEKWGTTVMMLIVFLVVAVCMVIIFYQWGKLLDKMTPLVTTMDTGLKLIVNKCGDGFITGALNQTNGGLIPA